MKTDLLKNSELFIFLALVFSVFTAVLIADKEQLSDEGKEFEIGIKTLGDNLNDKEKKIDSLNTIIRKYEDSISTYVNNTPAHIEIDGTNSFYFESRQSEILPEFEVFLKNTVLDSLVSYLSKCKDCNALYIVGHTDNKKVGSRNINFDDDIVSKINTDYDYQITNNSNTDLGIQRAISVYKLLKKQKELSQIKYWFPYSAGPFIDDETSQLAINLDISNESKNTRKRRIEIWLYAYKNNKTNR